MKTETILQRAIKLDDKIPKHFLTHGVVEETTQIALPQIQRLVEKCPQVFFVARDDFYISGKFEHKYER